MNLTVQRASRSFWRSLAGLSFQSFGMRPPLIACFSSAYRSAANEAFLIRNGCVSHIHRKKPKGRIMPEATRRANNAKSTIRSRIEHVFAEQKERMDLFIRTVGIARATTKIGLANLVYNIKRLIFLRRAVVA